MVRVPLGNFDVPGVQRIRERKGVFLTELLELLRKLHRFREGFFEGRRFGGGAQGDPKAQGIGAFGQNGHDGVTQGSAALGELTPQTPLLPTGPADPEAQAEHQAAHGRQHCLPTTHQSKDNTAASPWRSMSAPT